MTIFTLSFVDMIYNQSHSNELFLLLSLDQFPQWVWRSWPSSRSCAGVRGWTWTAWLEAAIPQQISAGVWAPSCTKTLTYTSLHTCSNSPAANTVLLSPALPRGYCRPADLFTSTDCRALPLVHKTQANTCAFQVNLTPKWPRFLMLRTVQ